MALAIGTVPALSAQGEGDPRLVRCNGVDGHWPRVQGFQAAVSPHSRSLYLMGSNVLDHGVHPTDISPTDTETSETSIIGPQRVQFPVEDTCVKMHGGFFVPSEYCLFCVDYTGSSASLCCFYISD